MNGEGEEGIVLDAFFVVGVADGAVFLKILLVMTTVILALLNLSSSEMRLVFFTISTETLLLFFHLFNQHFLSK